MKLRLNKNPIFLKYFLSYVLILLVSLIGFSFILNFNLKSEYEKTIDAKNQTSIEGLLDSIETQINGIRKIDYSLQQNVEIIFSRYNSGDFTRMTAINELKKYIAGVQIVKDVIYIDSLRNTVISANGASNIIGNDYCITLDKEIIKTPLDDFFELSNSSRLKKLVGKTETIFLYIPVPISTNCRTAYILNTHELNRLIKSSASPSITEIFLVDDDYSIIASNNRQDVIPYISLVENATKEHNSIDNSTDAYILKSKHDSISIVAFSDRQTVNDLVNRIFKNAYLTLLVISFVGMLITLVSMKITYSPIHRLIKKIGGNTSGASADIKSIEEAFYNTQIKNHELLDKVNNYRVAMQKSIFDSVAHSNEKDVNRAFSQIDTFFDPHIETCIFVVRLNLKSSLPSDEVADYIRQVLPHNGSCILIERVQNEFSYLINYPGIEDSKDKVLQMVFAEIHQDIGCKAAISSSSKNPIDIASLYENAKLASLFWDKHDVVVYDDIKDNVVDKSNISYPYKAYDKLAEALAALDFAMAQDTLTELFKLLDMRENPEFFLRCILIDTLTLIINSMNRLNIKFEKYDTVYFETLFLCRSGNYDEKKEVIIANIMSIISLFADEVANSSLQISQVKAFIKENYTSSDFSTVMLSDHFGVSIAYMSFIFKKKADINLSDYVWTLRVKKAKELLTDTALSIEEISGRVGYDNSSSFRRKFKGSLGVTPSQYRKKPD